MFCTHISIRKMDGEMEKCIASYLQFLRFYNFPPINHSNCTQHEDNVNKSVKSLSTIKRLTYS